MRNKALNADDKVQPLLRIREGVRQRLKIEATKNQRSLCAEMAVRLEASLPPVPKPRTRKPEAAQ